MRIETDAVTPAVRWLSGKYVATADKYPNLAKFKINRALLTISEYCELWKLKISIHKTLYNLMHA